MGSSTARAGFLHSAALLGIVALSSAAAPAPSAPVNLFAQDKTDSETILKDRRSFSGTESFRHDILTDIDHTEPQSEPITIPLPPAVWSGLSVLLGGGLWTSLRKLRRWLT